MSEESKPIAPIGASPACEICGREVVPPAVRCWGPDLTCYRLGYEKARASLSTAEKALRWIASPKYGLQGLMEDSAPESAFAEYWKELAQHYEAHAHAALSRSTAGDVPQAPPASDSSALEKALGALRAVEWKGEAGFWEEAGCPECRESQHYGHRHGCLLAAALSGGAHVDGPKAPKDPKDPLPQLGHGDRAEKEGE